jgi:hypothetical protein
MIQLVDRLPVRSGEVLRVEIESTDSDWRQGVALSTDGDFVIDGRSVGGDIVLWTDTAPPVVLVRVASTTGECRVKNVWDVGDGTVHSWHNGAAMTVDDTVAGRRYRCNDGHPDEDFDDLVFRIERFPSDSSPLRSSDGRRASR